MTIIVMDKTNWNVQTYRNVVSITLTGGVYTISVDTGDSTPTSLSFQQAQKLVRIMDS